MTAVLEVDDLSVRHGGVLALDRVALSVHGGEIVGLIGPNGAGKTTLIDTLSGFVAPATGTVRLQGDDITRTSPHHRSRRGLARTFQSLELFDDLDVYDNLLVAASDASRVGATRDLLGLAPEAHRLPAELSNGHRHRVALGRALVGSPQVVLLDEPAAGLDPTGTAELATLLAHLRDDGLGLLLVDHDMSLVLEVCDRVEVLDVGRVIASGAPETIRADPAVLDAYLGRQR